MVTIETFNDFFSEKIRKEENVSLVRNFTSKGDFKSKAKIFLDKTRPTGSRNKPFYKKYGEGNNSPQSAKFNMQKKFCIFCKKYGDHDCEFCKVKSFSQNYKEDNCMKHRASLCCLRTREHMINDCHKKIVYIMQKIPSL